jgi:hypothetical protein
MTPEQLTEILRLHKAWLNNEPNGVRADLSGANLREANLRASDLRGANLSGSDLSGSDLSGSDLSWANLCEADLREADLREANLCGSDLPIHPDAQQRLQAVARQVLAQPEHLQMTAWHSECGTAHCLAGWAIHQAGDLGRQLEADHGPAVAGLLLLGTEASQHFFDDNATALQWLQSVVEAQP